MLIIVLIILSMILPVGPAPPFTNRAFLIAQAAARRLAGCVEHHIKFHSKLEATLEVICTELESDVSAAIRKRRNEESYPVYKLLNGFMMTCSSFVGDQHYGLISYTSDRFHQIYSDTAGCGTLSSIRNAAVSVVCAKLYMAERGISDYCIPKK